MSRVVFYNDAPGGMSSGGGRIGVRVDGRGVASLPPGRYVVLDVAPGRHHLELSHSDTLTFSDEYTLQVDSSRLFVRLYRGSLTAGYEAEMEMPPGFSQRFKTIRR